MEYCRYSAAPVGRQLLDLHGEGRARWPPSDALCSALQVLNHLQDCGADYRALDRVYLPRERSRAVRRAGRGIGGERARARRCAPRSTACSTAPTGSSTQARCLPPAVESPGLRRECAVIVGLARRLARRLAPRRSARHARVKLTRGDFAAALLVGFLRGSA